MAERAGDQDAVVALRERRYLTAPEAAAGVSGALPRRPSRSHLLRRQGGSRERGDAAHAESTDRFRPPAAGGKPQDRLNAKLQRSQRDERIESARPQRRDHGGHARDGAKQQNHAAERQRIRRADAVEQRTEQT